MAGSRLSRQCPTCGREYGGEAAFCIKDGTPLVPLAAEAPAAAAAPGEPERARPKLVVDPPANGRSEANDGPGSAGQLAEEPAASLEPIRKETKAASSRKAAAPSRPAQPKGKGNRPARQRRAKAAPGASGSWGGAFARFRNPWMLAMAEDAPSGIEATVKAARELASTRQARRGGATKKGFSETLWFLEGARPDEASRLEKEGTVERDDGRYEKKRDLPDDLRSRYTLAKDGKRPERGR